MTLLQPIECHLFVRAFFQVVIASAQRVENLQIFMAGYLLYKQDVLKTSAHNHLNKPIHTSFCIYSGGQYFFPKYCFFL